jgi:hypothetical protein
MDRRIWILLAIAGAALLAWRLWPDRSSDSAPSRPAAGSATDFAQEDGQPASASRRGTPPKPVRMQARSAVGPRAGVAVVFESEDRDDGWARPREAEVRVRAGRVVADATTTLGAVECRSRSCRFALASDDPVALSRAIERLGEDSGLRDIAAQMTVEATEKGEGGPRRVNVYLRFER